MRRGEGEGGEEGEHSEGTAGHLSRTVRGQPTSQPTNQPTDPQVGLDLSRVDGPYPPAASFPAAVALLGGLTRMADSWYSQRTPWTPPCSRVSNPEAGIVHYSDVLIETP
jgi:hypothetical protein